MKEKLANNPNKLLEAPLAPSYSRQAAKRRQTLQPGLSTVRRGTFSEFHKDFAK